jgi:hypothetical protein
MFRSNASNQPGRERFTLSRSKRLERALVKRAISMTKNALPPKRQELGLPPPTPRSA